MASGAADVVIDNPLGVTINTGTPLMISNCERSTVFAATSAVTAAGETTLLHDVGGAGVQNSAQNIGAFTEGSQVTPLNTIVYYVRQDAGDPPTLWRKVDDDAAEALIPGIERLEVRYGVDENGDQLADTYFDADGVTDWRDVASVSIAVLVRSVEGLGTAEESRTFNMLGADVGPFNDRFQRTVFTTTATLRNLTP